MSMRDLIYYEATHEQAVLPALRENKPRLHKMAECNYVVNLKTGEVLKDRFHGTAGMFLDEYELQYLRKAKFKLRHGEMGFGENRRYFRNHFEDEGLFRV